MSETSTTSEALQHELYVWQRNGITRPIVPVDSEGVDYRDFRISEADQLIDLLKEDKKVTFVRANSGYGITKFFLPKLTDKLKKDGKKTYWTGGLSSGFAKDGKKREDLLIVDEIGQSRGGLEGGIEILTNYLAKNKNRRSLVIFDDEIEPKINILLERFEKEGQLIRGEIKPKLLSIHQSAQYGLLGDPNGVAGSKHTFFEGLNLNDSEVVIKTFSKRYPLHFRLIENLRNTVENGIITLDQKIEYLNSPTFNYQFDEVLTQGDIVNTGIVKKQ